jgi:hypothetical protein
MKKLDCKEHHGDCQNDGQIGVFGRVVRDRQDDNRSGFFRLSRDR